MDDDLLVLGLALTADPEPPHRPGLLSVFTLALIVGALLYVAAHAAGWV
jgi:hypothetical protein